MISAIHLAFATTIQYPAAAILVTRWFAMTEIFAPLIIVTHLQHAYSAAFPDVTTPVIRLPASTIIFALRTAAATAYVPSPTLIVMTTTPAQTNSATWEHACTIHLLHQLQRLMHHLRCTKAVYPEVVILIRTIRTLHFFRSRSTQPEIF